ncbi:hypothetical protein KAU11_10685 [Candidatus Babeliales bacterium]|nr:hypothetical protein [Candidatus Babeliales bacterium]
MDTLEIFRKHLNSNMDEVIWVWIVELYLKDEMLFHEVIQNKGILKSEFIKMIAAQVFIYKTTYMLNRTNKKALALLGMLGYGTNKINVGTLTVNFNNIWRGKVGITNTGNSYRLLDATKTLYLLEKFVSNYPQFTSDVIIRATKEFFDTLPIEHGKYKYAPKSETFITGNVNNEYLKKLCEDIEKRDKLSNLNIIDDYYEGI